MGEFHITAGELLRRLPASIAPLAFALLLLLPLPAHGDDVEKGIAAAADIAANQPKPFVDTVCPLMQQQADAMGLPAMFFVRLIWKESRFNPGAVSPKGAQGIAQLMPGTASDRGLDDPFEPKSAIVHSASLLADLKSEFGNVGLAAAAYNAGAERVRAWLDGRSSLPAETVGYVSFVTGRDAEEWKLPETDLPDSLKTPAENVVESCRKLAPLVVRAVYETEPLTASGAWRPWGIQVSTSFSKARALSTFARLQRRYASVLSEREPFVLPERNLSRGRRALYMVQIGADARDDAIKLCAELRARGGACIVQKN
jgi:Transglycosylase SLT domain/SPOR domain